MATVNEIVGFLKLKGGEQFGRELKGRLAGVRESFMSINKAIVGTGLVLFLKNVNDAANSLSQANRQLAATSKLTGVDLNSLTTIAQNAEQSFKLSTQQANQFTIAVSKLTGKAGELGKTGDAIGRLLDLAAAQGLDAEQALIAINQAILGIDEGTDKLFQKNPSAIYAEYAKQIGTSAGKLTDQQKAQALLNAVMTDGLKVQGEYQSFLNDAPGKQAQFATALQRTSASLGQMVQTILTPFLELLTKIVDWFNNLSEGAKNFAVSLGAVTTAAYLFGGALAALLPMIGPAGWVLVALGAVAGLFFTLEGRTRGAAQATEEFRSSLAALSLEQAEKKLADLEEQLRNFRLEMRATNTNLGGTVIPVNLAEKKQLEEQIEILRKAVEEKRRLAQAAAAVPAPVIAGPSDKEIEAMKDRLDNQREFEFKHQQISRENYLAYLQTRQRDFEQWSGEWVSLQERIMGLQKDVDADQINATREAVGKEFKIRGQAAQEKLKLVRATKNAELDELRAGLEAQRQLAQEHAQRVMDQAMLIRDAIANIGLAVAESIRTGGNAFKTFFKQVLIVALDAIERYFILAKIKAILDAAINPFAALKSIAPLAIASGLLQVAKGQIAALAEGTVATRPTLAVVGEKGTEIVAPQKKFDDFTEELLRRALNGRGGRGGQSVVINNHFASPLNDRRTAERMTNEVLRPEVKRELRRDERKLQLNIFNE